MNNMSQYDHMRQTALYLLCWGESAQVQFVPVCLCFIFKCADDYYRSPECQNRVNPIPEGLYLRAVIKPLYCFIRDRDYEFVDGKFVWQEHDHDRIIGYDDVNQLFWYPEGIARIVLSDKVCQLFMTRINVLIFLCQTRLVDIPPARHFMCFDHIDWNRAFFKMYYKKWSFGHLLINFNRNWVIHISLFRFYTTYNAPTIYQPKRGHSSALTWSATALWGAVATIIMILATLAEFSYIPPHPSATFPPCHSCSYGRPYILHHHRGESSRWGWIPHSHSRYCPAFHFYRVTLLFGIMPSGRMFGDWVASKSRMYLMSQTFTASYPTYILKHA